MTHCKACDEYDIYRCNGDLHWCAECGDTENIEFMEDEEICPFCGDSTSDYPNNGYAHLDCARDFEIYEESKPPRPEGI